MERWKTGKNDEKGITNLKKDKKEKNTHLKKRRKEKRERENSFLNGNAFFSFPVPENFDQRTSRSGITLSYWPINQGDWSFSEMCNVVTVAIALSISVQYFWNQSSGMECYLKCLKNYCWAIPIDGHFASGTSMTSPIVATTCVVRQRPRDAPMEQSQYSAQNYNYNLMFIVGVSRQGFGFLLGMWGFS